MATDAAGVLDKPESRPGRYLREHKVRLVLWIGAIEGTLALLGAFDKWVLYVLAIASIAWYVAMGRKYTSPTARHISWIFAASQAIAVVIQAMYQAFKWLAFGAIVVAVIAGLVLLFAERDKL
jgi:hypothetical protein